MFNMTALLVSASVTTLFWGTVKIIIQIWKW